MSFQRKLLAVFSLTVFFSVAAVTAIISSVTRQAFERVDEERTAALVAQFQREFKEKTPLDEFGGGPRPENMKRLKAMVGKDNPMQPANARDRERSKFLGHFSSEYIMVYYDEKYLKPAKNYVDTLPDGKNYNIYQDRSTVIWHAPKHLSPAPWTDDYSNLVRIMRGLPVFGINNEFD